VFICYENHPIFAKTLFVPLPSCSFSFLFFLFWPVWSVPLKYLLISECFFQEHLVRTRCGSVTVAVYGDEDKPALITYPDVALNCKCFQRFSNLLIICYDWNPQSAYEHCLYVSVSYLAWTDMSCFQGLLFCPEAASLQLHNFCIYHINPQGHEVSNGGSIFVMRCAWFVFWVAYMIFAAVYVKSPTVGSSSDIIRCAGANCWWSRWSSRRCAWFLQVLYCQFVTWH